MAAQAVAKASGSGAVKAPTAEEGGETVQAARRPNANGHVPKSAATLPLRPSRERSRSPLLSTVTQLPSGPTLNWKSEWWMAAAAVAWLDSTVASKMTQPRISVKKSTPPSHPRLLLPALTTLLSYAWSAYCPGATHHSSAALPSGAYPRPRISVGLPCGSPPSSGDTTRQDTSEAWYTPLPEKTASTRVPPPAMQPLKPRRAEVTSICGWEGGGREWWWGTIEE